MTQQKFRGVIPAAHFPFGVGSNDGYNAVQLHTFHLVVEEVISEELGLGDRETFGFERE